MGLMRTSCQHLPVVGYKQIQLVDCDVDFWEFWTFLRYFEAIPTGRLRDELMTNFKDKG